MLRKLEHGGVRSLDQSHTISIWLGWNLNQGTAAQELMLLATIPHVEKYLFTL